MMSEEKNKVPDELVVDIASKALDDFIPYLQGRLFDIDIDVLLRFEPIKNDFIENVIKQMLTDKVNE